MLKPQRLLARRPLHEPHKQRLRALKPRDRARTRRRRPPLLAAHGLLITVPAFQHRLAHRAVSLPGPSEQVEQIRSHAITSVSRPERDITPGVSPPPTATPSETYANPGDKTLPNAAIAKEPALSTHYKRPAPSGISLGRPVKRSLQFSDFVRLGGPSHEWHSPALPCTQRMNETAALPSPMVLFPLGSIDTTAAPNAHLAPRPLSSSVGLSYSIAPPTLGAQRRVATPRASSLQHCRCSITTSDRNSIVVDRSPIRRRKIDLYVA